MTTDKILKLMQDVEEADKLFTEDESVVKFIGQHAEIFEPFADAVIALMNELYREAGRCPHGIVADEQPDCEACYADAG